MLRAILNKSWQQHPTRHQLYGHLPPITKTIQVRRTRYAGPCWRSRDELIRDVLLWTPTHGRAKADDQLEHTFSNYVRIRDVVQKTSLRRWTIGKCGEKGSGISVLPARHDDNDTGRRQYSSVKKVLKFPSVSDWGVTICLLRRDVLYTTHIHNNDINPTVHIQMQIQRNTNTGENRQTQKLHSQHEYVK